jgi:AcrR family transcriptional regulator
MRERSVERILNTALNLFAERGYQGATISQITERAGISRGLVSYYFPSKQALLDAILSRLMNWILDLVRSVPRTGTAEERLAHLVDSTLRSVRQNPELHRMEMGLHLQPGTVDLVRDFEVTHAEEFDEYRRTLRELFAAKGSKDPDGEQLYFRTVMEGIVFKYCVYGEAYAILEMRRQLYRTFGLGEPGPLD